MRLMFTQSNLKRFVSGKVGFVKRPGCLAPWGPPVCPVVPLDSLSFIYSTSHLLNPVHSGSYLAGGGVTVSAQRACRLCTAASQAIK